MMTDDIKAEVTAMFLGASPALKAYKDEVGSQKFIVELNEILTEAERVNTLTALVGALNASLNWAAVDAILAKNLSTEMIPKLLQTARTAATERKTNLLVACLLAVLGADPRGK